MVKRPGRSFSPVSARPLFSFGKEKSTRVSLWVDLIFLKAKRKPSDERLAQIFAMVVAHVGIKYHRSEIVNDTALPGISYGRMAAPRPHQIAGLAAPPPLPGPVVTDAY